MIERKKSKLFTLSISSTIFTLAIFGVFYLTDLNKESFNADTVQFNGAFGNSQNKQICGKMCGCHQKKGLNLTLGKLCRGGPYMWQGDDPLAKACRELGDTEDGLRELKRYECGAGFSGMPDCPGFQYTTLSNDKWENERCNNLNSCDVLKNGIF